MRNEIGRARAILLLGLILCGTALAWLAGSLRQASSAYPPAGADPARATLAASPDMPSAQLALEDRGSRRPGADAAEQPPGGPVPKPAPSSATGPTWAACLDRAEAPEVRECLRSLLDARPDAGEVARFLCSDRRDPHRHLMLASEALARIPAPEALDWIDQVQLGCQRYRENDLWEACLLARQEQDPAWLQEFRATLTPERMFASGSGDAGVQIAAFFAAKGDRDAQEWIQAGAHGDWGGSIEQIDRAIGVSISLQPPGQPWLENLRSILQSSRVPEGGALGSTFVHALIDPRAWPEGQSGPALETLSSLLYDARFQESAAATLCLSFSPEPPAGCDAAAWQAVRARALEIAAQIGLSLPNGPR